MRYGERHSGEGQMAHGQHGFTLIEVLVAVLVLAIGLLGIAGLQAAGLQMNNSAYQRSQAAVLTQDMADRARANTEGYQTGAYNIGDPTSLSVTDSCFTTDGCSPTQLAQSDVARWRETVQELLPGGEGTICQDNDPETGTSETSPDCSGTGNYVIKIWWTNDREGGEKYRYETEIRAL